jgi:hypothetical protein
MPRADLDYKSKRLLERIAKALETIAAKEEKCIHHYQLLEEPVIENDFDLADKEFSD